MEKHFYLLKKNIRKRKKNLKKRVKEEGSLELVRVAHIFALLKNMTAAPTSLLLIKRSGAPPPLLLLRSLFWEWRSLTHCILDAKVYRFTLFEQNKLRVKVIIC
jgi:hypothetical protein